MDESENPEGKNFGQEFHTEESLSLYPNPASGNVYVEWKGENSVLEIRDFMGRMVKTQKLQNGKTELPLGNLSNGIYQIQVLGTTKTHSSTLQVIR